MEPSQREDPKVQMGLNTHGIGKGIVKYEKSTDLRRERSGECCAEEEGSSLSLRKLVFPSKRETVAQGSWTQSSVPQWLIWERRALKFLAWKY